jgi:hypothetical protein
MPSDQVRLQEFVDDSQEVLHDVINGHDELIPADLRRDFRRAWRDVEPQFPIVREGIGALEDTRLRDLGLAGNQLTLKLSGFERARAALTTRWTKRALKKVLEWMNVLFGSILAGVAAAEPIKEIKEALEASLEDE